METIQDLFIPSSDGIRLHVRLHMPAGRALDDVICLPGLTRDWRDFEELSKKLTAIGYRVAALDFRGRGLSAHDPDSSHYHIPYEAVDTLQIMAALKMPSAHFIGTSRGGMVTMYLATVARDKIKTAILNDIGPVLEMKGLLRIASYVGKAKPTLSWDDAILSLQRSNPGFDSYTHDDWLRFAKSTFVESGDALKLLYDPAIGHVFTMLDPSKPFPTLWPWYDALAGVDTLIIRGENSDLLTEETCADMLAHHSRSSLFIARGEAHAPMLGRSPTAQAIIDFIGKQRQEFSSDRL